MDKQQAQKIVDKCMLVILSCKTHNQLCTAVKYSDFAYRLLQKEIGLINNMNFLCLIERSIGFAQCQIKGSHSELIK